MKSLIIIGGGGHAKVLIAAVRSSGEFLIQGILDEQGKDRNVLNVPILGRDTLLEEGRFRGSLLAIGVGLIRAGDTRKNLYDRFREMKYEFPAIRHAAAVVDQTVSVGEGAQIMAGAVVQPDARLAANCIINTAAVVEHDCQIGAHSHICPGAVLGGGVVVGECSLVGLGARVLPGIRIGKNATVGAGAVVTRDVGEGQTVTGVPAGRTASP